MEWPVIVAIAVLVPIFLFPAALVWYVNVTGIFEVWNDRRKKAGAKKATAAAKQPSSSCPQVDEDIKEAKMKALQVAVPILGTGCLTAGCVYLAIWLTGLVPDGEWASLIKGLLVVGIIIGALVTVAWSAYFSLIFRRVMKV